jgi:hypothetical protein
VEIQRVQSLDDLRARTPEEKTRAAYFNDANPSEPIARLLALGGSKFRNPGSPIVDVSVEYVIRGGNFSPEEIQAMRDQDRREREARRRTWICSLDAIIVGRVESRRALMTTNEDWMFTDYTVVVDRWIQQRGHSSATPSAAIERLRVSRFGGEAEVAGRRLSAWGPSRLLPVGEPLLLLLREIGSGAGLVDSSPDPVAGRIYDSFTGMEMGPEEYVAQVTADAARCATAR